MRFVTVLGNIHKNFKGGLPGTSMIIIKGVWTMNEINKKEKLGIKLVLRPYFTFVLKNILRNIYQGIIDIMEVEA